MAKEKFILVSLKEEESKQLAQVMANDTARKILDHLADKESTESELAEKLAIPISTVHYNLQALVKGKLVEAEEFHYSEKGKEVLHYKLANKYIIIAPKSTFGIKEKLRSILPVLLIGVFGSLGLYFYKPFQETIPTAAPMMAKAAPEAAMMAADSFAATAPASVSVPSFWQILIQEPALWFLVGCILTAALIFVGEYIQYKRK